MLTAKHKFIMKEKILSAFKKLGFNLKPVDECEDCNHFEFEYEDDDFDDDDDIDIEEEDDDDETEELYGEDED